MSGPEPAVGLRWGCSSPHHWKEVQESVSAQRTHSQADAELDDELEHAGAGSKQEQHDSGQRRQGDHHVGESRIQVS